MSTFPPKQWQIRFLQDMETLECEPREVEGVYLESYVAVRPAGGAEGSFRFTLSGAEKLKLAFPISKVLPGPEFEGLNAELELWPGQQIKIEKNSVATSWWDLEDLVGAQDAAIVDAQGEDRSEEFLVAIGHDKELAQQAADRRGLCIRWVLGTRAGSQQVALLAQVIRIINDITTLPFCHLQFA